MSVVQRTNRALDRLPAAARPVWAGFPFAVVKKYGDDQAGSLATLIAYYGFFSAFPLMLVLVSVLGIVLADNQTSNSGSSHPRSPSSRSSDRRSPRR